MRHNGDRFDDSIHDGKEVGRILGYPGESFFWGYLEEIVEKNIHSKDSEKVAAAEKLQKKIDELERRITPKQSGAF